MMRGVCGGVAKAKSVPVPGTLLMVSFAPRVRVVLERQDDRVRIVVELDQEPLERHRHGASP
jgi:hypothetical protein